jgi:hypothetical protein
LLALRDRHARLAQVMRAHVELEAFIDSERHAAGLELQRLIDASRDADGVALGSPEESAYWDAYSTASHFPVTL